MADLNLTEREPSARSPHPMRRDLRRSPLRLSPSSIAVFQQCPQQYKFRYIDRLGDQYLKPRPYYTMANHVHTALKGLLSAPPELRTVAMAEKLLRDSWMHSRLGFRGERDEKHWLDRALAQVKAFACSPYAGGSPLMLEAPVEALVSPGVMLYGRVDRVDWEGDGSLHIIDYKTGNPTSEVDWTQLELHALILSLARASRVSRVSFLQLADCTLLTRGLLPQELEQTRWELLRIALKIRRDRQHLPQPGAWCRGCDFTPICPMREPKEPQKDMQGQLELWEEFRDDI